MALDKYYDASISEKKWQSFWEKNNIFAYDKNGDKDNSYTIDTPPPTVSGKLHIGHVFSYTQTEVIARYQRMKGKNVMYPFGFDDNGLPTEILTEREKGVKAANLPREEFAKKCQEVSSKYREQFKELWKSLGFSCDWHSAYSTISPQSQRISQRSFLDLFKKDFVEYKSMPTLWCTKCQTSFAQAEIDDVNKATIFHYFHFTAENGEKIPIASTRPELLPACVSVFIHPQNEKFRHLIGREVTVPIFGHKVPILADEKADPEKGTGVVMSCTFGDITDIDWWREHKLPTRIRFTRDGKMTNNCGKYAGFTINEARKAIGDDLQEQGYTFKREELAAESRIVNTHERCKTPVEYLDTKQWFIKVVDNKQALIKQGEKINWYPEYMGKRYRDWVENLSWDWAISRQRYFGVPIPVWYTKDGEVIPADESQLPVNPLVDKPLGYEEQDDLVGEVDVLDTWATSSITPQLNAKWGEPDEDNNMRLMSMRPQAHDIIRTWAFYTIVKSFYHFNDIPWQDAVISGHVIKKEQQVQTQKIEGQTHIRKSKISKSKDGEKFSPIKIIDTFGADAVRYWTCSGTLGTDISYDKESLKTVKKLLNKLWNCAKFAERFLEDFTPNKKVPYLVAIDKWALARFNKVIEAYHNSFEKYEFFNARNKLEKFFWGTFCDNYLEFIKDRFWNPDKYSAEQVYSAKWTLYTLIIGQLKLFAPYIPHITEEIFQGLFAKKNQSLHKELFPQTIVQVIDEQASQAGNLLVDLVSEVRGYKSKNNYSLKLPIDTLTIACESEVQKLIELVAHDFKASIKASYLAYQVSLEDSNCQIKQAGMNIKMDEQALFRQDLIMAIKPVITKLKQEVGLKSKEGIKTLFIQAENKELETLQSEDGKQQLLVVSCAEEVFFNEDKDYTSVAGQNIGVMINV